MKQFRALISGRVQGVYFRAETVAAARRAGCRGFARNLADGRVEVVAAGPAEALEELILFLHQGPRLARVEEVALDWEDTTPLGDTFEIRH